MDAILDIARRKGIPLVEDVAQAGGGSFQGQRLGSLGTLGCFSFDYYKVHASGEGGFVTTDDAWLVHPGAELARHGRLLASRPLRPRASGGRAVLRRELPDERIAGRRGLGANPQDRRHAGRLPPRPSPDPGRHRAACPA